MLTRNNYHKIDWSGLSRTWNMWWDGALNRPLVMYERLDPDWAREIQTKHGLSELPARESSLSFTGQFGFDTPANEVLQFYQDLMNHIEIFGDAFPRFWPNYGPGVVAAFLGGDFRIQDDTTWISPPKTKEGISFNTLPLDEITITHNPVHPLWRRIYGLTAGAVILWKDRVSVGITDLGGNLDILASLIGSERLAMEMLDNPEQVERLCREIRRAWMYYYDQLYALIDVDSIGCSCWAAVWAPERYYMFQSDFAYMISPEMFRRFVIPDLQACAEKIPYAFYHLDGKGQIPHLNHLLALDSLRGIQWIPGESAPPPEEWLSLLEKIIAGDKRCQLYVSAEGARRIVNELGGEGFAFYITDNLTPEESEALVKELTGE